MKDMVNNKVQELRETIIKTNKLNKIENDFSNKNIRESIKLGAKFNKLLKSFLSTETGLQLLINLMNDENSIVRFIIARNLYPLFPTKTILIMKEYLKSVDDKLEIMRIKDVIAGFESKQKIFMEQFKKLYNCEDLDSLNREK